MGWDGMGWVCFPLLFRSVRLTDQKTSIRPFFFFAILSDLGQEKKKQKSSSNKNKQINKQQQPQQSLSHFHYWESCCKLLYSFWWIKFVPKYIEEKNAS
jgi:hypothetical protein